MLPPDAWAEEHPDALLDCVDGLRAGRRRGHRPGPPTARGAIPSASQGDPERDARGDPACPPRARARPARARHLPRDAAAQRRARRDADPAPARRRRPLRPPPPPRLLRQRRPRRAPGAGLARRPRRAARAGAHDQVASPPGRRRARRRAWRRRAGACWTTSSRRSRCPAARWALGVQWHPEVDPRSRVVAALARRGGARAGRARARPSAAVRSARSGPDLARGIAASVRRSTAIRAAAGTALAAGVAAPLVRRRLSLPPPVVIAAPRRRAVRAVRPRPALARADVGAVPLQMWAYVATYQMPNDDPRRSRRASTSTTRWRVDRVLGARRAADAAAPARAGAPAGFAPLGEGAGLVALAVVPVPARHRRLPAAAPPRPLPAPAPRGSTRRSTSA